MDNDLKWFNMSIAEQLANIGSEVNRAVMWDKRNDKEKARNFCKKAIDFLNIIKRDPKNQNRVNEFNEAIIELDDRFLGDNMYDTNDDVLLAYYDAFIYMV